jgi:hypothetical protein
VPTFRVNVRGPSITEPEVGHLVEAWRKALLEANLSDISVDPEGQLVVRLDIDAETPKDAIEAAVARVKGVLRSAGVRVHLVADTFPHW